MGICPYSKAECEHFCTRGEQQTIPYDVIVKDLNERTGKHYRDVTATRRLIQARWNEGFREEAFFAVHKNMAAAWIGTDQEMYLRPATLYCASKFEGYLNKNVSGAQGATLHDKMLQAARAKKPFSEEALGRELKDFVYATLRQHKIKWPDFCEAISTGATFAELLSQPTDLKMRAAGDST